MQKLYNGKQLLNLGLSFALVHIILWGTVTFSLVLVTPFKIPHFSCIPIWWQMIH